MNQLNKIQFDKLLIRRFGDLLTVIHRDYIPSSIHDWTQELRRFTETLVLRGKTRGPREMVTWAKDIHHIAVSIAMGRPFLPLPFTKSDKSGIPRVIKPLVPFLRGPNIEKRLALSVTKVYLRIRLDPEIDLQSIEERPPNFTMNESWVRFLQKWVRKFPQPNLEWDGDWHGTTKAGPNGPALVSAHQDLQALSNDPQVLEHLKSWMSFTSPSLLRVFESLRIKWSGIAPHGTSHSTLKSLSEGGGKTRVVAIADYFTQESMKSLFRDSMKALRQLETDGTYDQRNVVERTQQAIRNGKPIHCLDLSSATDRFPVSLQEDLLCAWIGRDRSRSWRNTLTKRGFELGEENVVYGAGQPMGILSSWSIFALTHHAIIEYIAFLEGYQSFRDYVVLGDDVAIFNTTVAERYESEMKRFGVTISPAKSFKWVPGDKFDPSGEIAKRLVNREGEFSPLPYELVHTWSRAPDKEALTLRMGLQNIGLDLSHAAWETLALTLGKRSRKRFHLLTTIPSELIAPRKNLIALHNIEVTEDSPWSKIDLTMIEPVMVYFLIKDLCKKRDSIFSIHSELFEEKFWDQFKDRKGVPISRSVLGLGHLTIENLHPLVCVINNRLEKLWNVEEIISNLRNNPSQVFICWDDIFNYDFNISRTYLPRQRTNSYKQSSILLDLYRNLESGKEPGQMISETSEKNVTSV